MNILIVGAGAAGSFQMRAVQLGAALGARVTSVPLEADWAWADVVVLVKRAAWIWAERAHRSGVPVVWDAVDFWRQPADNSMSEAGARGLLANALAEIRPTLTIGATEAMAAGAGGVCLPHHGRLGLRPGAVRREVRAVGYDGNATYLDHWRPALERACASRGWTFVVNPPSLHDVDILVALRGGPWDGWMCQHWKSGVKVANAILAARPLITQPSAAAGELASPGSIVTRVEELPDALDTWATMDRRQAVSNECLRRLEEFHVDTMAARYRAILARVLESVPC